MKTGNVIIADGKVGVITSYLMPPYKMIDGKPYAEKIWKMIEPPFEKL